jgi:hypothetical protein
MQLRQELRLLVKGGKAANSVRDAVAQRRVVAAIVLSRWSGGDPSLRFWISSVKGNAVSAAVRLGLSMPVDQQFPQSEPLRFWHCLGTARLSASDYITEGGARSERRGSSWQELSSLAKQQTRKGKLYEKASLNCIGDKWIGFRSRAAF